MELGKKILSMLVLLMIVHVTLTTGGCGDSDNDNNGYHPADLAGTWNEKGYDRQMVLEVDGSFEYVSIAEGIPGDVEGSGTWDVTDNDLTLHLRSGYFRWLESVNNAPISFTFHYEVTNETLRLTFEIMSQVSIAEYTLVN